MVVEVLVVTATLKAEVQVVVVHTGILTLETETLLLQHLLKVQMVEQHKVQQDLTIEVEVAVELQKQEILMV